MNTALKNTYDPDLASRTTTYILKNNLSKKDLGEKIGIHRTTITNYLNGQTASIPPRKILQIESALRVLVDNANPTLWERDYFHRTSDSDRIIAVCQSSQDYAALGVIAGRSGFGKTFTLKQFAKNRHVLYMECEVSMTSRDLTAALEECVGLPPGTGTVCRRMKNIKEFFNANNGYLLIIDEFDKLITRFSTNKVEMIRSLFDQSQVGIVIAGELQIENMIKQFHGQFANRVSYIHRMNGLKGKEIEAYLNGLIIRKPALDEMKSRGMNDKDGCFRLLGRTLESSLRIADGGEITLDVIESANSMTMFGGGKHHG